MANITTNALRLVENGSKMKLTNFYLDEYTKAEVQKKLILAGLTGNDLAATIRTMLRYFVENDIPGVIEQIATDAIICKKKNKKSRL